MTFVVLILLILAGCAPAMDADQPEVAGLSPFTLTPSAIPAAQTPTDLGETTVMVPTTLPTPGDSVLRGLIDEAKADLAQRLSLSVDQIILLEAVSVVWSDSSLGCPEEGMAYAQVLTPGYLIRLEADGQEYEYHASRSSVFYCQNPSPPVPGTPPDV